MNTLLTKIKSFYSTYKWLLIPIIPSIFFIFLIFYISSLQTKQSIPPVNTQGGTIASPTQSANPAEKNQPYTLTQEEQDIAFKKIKLDNEKMAETSISQETLSDGSIKYKYASFDRNRPHMQIVKDSVPIFRRNLVSNATLADYSSFLKNPEYQRRGSSYYGNTAILYASPTKGIAVVADTKTGKVYEQYIFTALSVAEYLQKYGSDISTY